MGYYTDFNIHLSLFDLETRAPATEFVPALYSQEIKRQLEECSGYEFEDSDSAFLYLDEAKWYDHHEDLLAVSKNFPGVLIEVYGDGEDSEDNWVSYYLNGQHSGGQGTIVYPEFDVEDHFKDETTTNHQQ